MWYHKVLRPGSVESGLVWYSSWMSYLSTNAQLLAMKSDSCERPIKSLLLSIRLKSMTPLMTRANTISATVRPLVTVYAIWRPLATWVVSNWNWRKAIISNPAITAARSVTAVNCSCFSSCNTIQIFELRRVKIEYYITLQSVHNL